MGEKNILLNASVAHTWMRMMQFTSWMGAAEVLGGPNPFCTLQISDMLSM